MFTVIVCIWLKSCVQDVRWAFRAEIFFRWYLRHLEGDRVQTVYPAAVLFGDICWHCRWHREPADPAILAAVDHWRFDADQTMPSCFSVCRKCNWNSLSNLPKNTNTISTEYCEKFRCYFSVTNTLMVPVAESSLEDLSSSSLANISLSPSTSNSCSGLYYYIHVLFESNPLN